MNAFERIRRFCFGVRYNLTHDQASLLIDTVPLKRHASHLTMDQYEMMEEVAEQFSEYTNSIVRYNSAGFYVLAKDETELVQWKLMWL